MLVVGNSLARAFGIVGVASLIRYRARIDDPDVVQPLGQEAQALVDVTQLPLAIDVLGVLGAVALGGGIGQRGDDLRALLRAQEGQLFRQAFEAGGRYVVRRRRRLLRRLLGHGTTCYTSCA